MLFSSGIGTYLQNIIPKISPFFDITLLLIKKDLSWDSSFKSILFNTPIYTAEEQLLYPLKIPHCDIFWSPHYNIPLLPIRAKKRAVTIHDICHLAHPSSFPKAKQKIASKVLQAAINKSDLIMTVSEFSKKEITSRLCYKNKLIHVVAGAANPAPISAAYLDIQRPFLLYVGNEKRHKNASSLLEAFCLLPNLYHLVMVTPKNFPKKYHPRIHYLHNLSTEELHFLYQTALALISPSLYEGFGLVPLEAMQNGCPAIVSNLASFPEVCKDAAFYINPYSISSISTGIQKVLENESLRKSLIKKGHERALCFSWDRSASLVKELFLSLACL
jgi:glycosyltransferase involved in cell wall biosynthesis